MTVSLQQDFQDRIAEVMTALRAGRRDEARSQAEVLPLDLLRCLRIAAAQLKELASLDDFHLFAFAEILSDCARGKPFAINLTKPLNVAAKTLLDREDWRGGARILGLVLDLVPNQPLALYRLSNAMIEMGELSKGLAHARSLLLAEPLHVGAANLVASNADLKTVSELGALVAPLAIAQADADLEAIGPCVRVLARLMCFEQVHQLLDRLPHLNDPVVAKAVFDTAIETSDPDLATRALVERRWSPEADDLEREVWLARLALLKCDRNGLASSFQRLADADRLDLLGASFRMIAPALGLYTENFNKNWTSARRRRIATMTRLIDQGDPLGDFVGANVLIIAYAELGDEIRLLELVDRLREICASCTIVVDRRIADLTARERETLTVIGKEKLATCPDDENVPEILRRHLGAEQWSTIDRFDKVLLITDLQPLLLERESNLPRYRKTLHADAALRENWKVNLAKWGRPRRIGLFWRSGVITYRRSNKATDLKDWKPILDSCKQALLVSLQFGSSVTSEINAMKPDYDIVEMPNLDTKLDIESVAALMCELDFVVTTPGTTMHLAGALGVRTLAVTHPSQALERARADGVTGIWSKNVEIITGPPGEGFPGAILATARRLRALLTNPISADR